jgi:RNA polymerase sigma-70 factor (ECF subfamily)
MEDVGARLAAQEARLALLLHHLAGRAIRARVEVDDLVQEVFVRALQPPRRWPPEAPGDAALARYLAHLARHVVVDVARALRASKRDGRESPLVRSDWSMAGVHESQLAAQTAGPGTRVAARTELERLARAFHALPPDHRRVIGLRQFEGLDARETARRMGRSETAVHSLYRRALLAWSEEP